MATTQVYSLREVARAAGVPVRRVADLVASGQAASPHGLIGEADAVRLVQILGGRARLRLGDRMPLPLPRPPRRKAAASLVASGFLHGALLGLFALIASLGLLAAHDTDQLVPHPSDTRLVYLVDPGPGGGGGGGGTSTPAPPPPAERKAVEPIKIDSPVPPVRKVAPPPRPIIATPPPPVLPPRVEPARIEPLKDPAPQVVVAPIMPSPANRIDTVGTLEAMATPPPTPSNGPGIGGGVGTGAGAGLGEGQGSGLGPGSGGGTGGGPYQPGNGIDPPTLLHEVKPVYTEEARRQGIEGAVLLEIVVQRDGSVGSLKVMRSLGAGLERKAVEAVRQWRFAPARRQGAPVDVVVQVSVDFSLRN